MLDSSKEAELVNYFDATVCSLILASNDEGVGAQSVLTKQTANIATSGATKKSKVANKKENTSNAEQWSLSALQQASKM